MQSMYQHKCENCTLFASEVDDERTSGQIIDWYVCDRDTTRTNERILVWRRGNEDSDYGSHPIRPSFDLLNNFRFRQALRMGLVLTQLEANDLLRILLGLTTKQVR